MIRLTRFACAMLLAAGLCAAAVAQDQSGQSGQNNQAAGPHPGMRRGEMNITPQERVERMSRMLNLTDDQKTKLTGIFEQQQKQMQELRGNTSLSQQDKFAKMKENREWTTAQVRGVLNAEQQQKLDKMEERMKERRERGGPAAQGQPQSQPQQ